MKELRHVSSTAISKSMLLVSLTLCVFSCSKPTTEALLDKVLSEGPTEDEAEIPSHMKANAEKHGPVFPIMPYKKMQPFLPEKVGVFSREDQLIPSSACGFPMLLAIYHAEVAGKDQTVRLIVRDNRQANGGTDRRMMEIARERAGAAAVEKSHIGRFPMYIQDKSKYCALVGRFAVWVDVGDAQREIALEFFEAIDLEQLSQLK